METILTIDRTSTLPSPDLLQRCVAERESSHDRRFSSRSPEGTGNGSLEACHAREYVPEAGLEWQVCSWNHKCRRRCMS